MNTDDETTPAIIIRRIPDISPCWVAETPVHDGVSGAYQPGGKVQMRRLCRTVAISAGFVIGASAGFAAEISSADRNFVNEAAAGGLAEVQDAQLAQQKSASSDVKQFAGTMITDHTQANTELKQIAHGKGITPPNAPTRAQQSAQEDLKKLSGGAFDRQYMKQQVRTTRRRCCCSKRRRTPRRMLSSKRSPKNTYPSCRSTCRWLSPSP
jgi:predicted outer membrane protein